MESIDQNKFRKIVFRSLFKKVITKEEAKECLKRGFGKQEIPIFFDFEPIELPLQNYVTGLEKMQIIEPLIRLNDE